MGPPSYWSSFVCLVALSSLTACASSGSAVGTLLTTSSTDTKKEIAAGVAATHAMFMRQAEIRQAKLDAAIARCYQKWPSAPNRPIVPITQCLNAAEAKDADENSFGNIHADIREWVAAKKVATARLYDAKEISYAEYRSRIAEIIMQGNTQMAIR